MGRWLDACAGSPDLKMGATSPCRTAVRGRAARIVSPLGASRRSSRSRNGPAPVNSIVLPGPTAPTAAPVPHCKIDGYVTTTNPGPNQVNFRLQLPDQGWKGRYYFIGMGGSVIKPCISGTMQKTAGARVTLGFAIFYMIMNFAFGIGR